MTKIETYRPRIADNLLIRKYLSPRAAWADRYF